MSETGPYAIWQMPNATKNTINVACVAEVEALRSAEIAGSAGKYMSIAKGPMAVRRPNTIAFRANVGGMSRDHRLLIVDSQSGRAALSRLVRDRRFTIRPHRFSDRHDDHEQATDVAFVAKAQCLRSAALYTDPSLRRNSGRSCRWTAVIRRIGRARSVRYTELAPTRFKDF